jgi:hypothetical protein
MKNLICTRKQAFAKARLYFNRKRLKDSCLIYSVMGGNNPYHLFIYKGEAFEIRH